MNTFSSVKEVIAPFNPFHFESLVWDWPIAVYLFLVGISAGMVIIAIILKIFVLDPKGIKANENAIMKAMAIVAPISVMFGLFILIFHLSRPWHFWKIMVFYSPVSVMSIGVVLFQLYMIALFIWLFVLFEKEVMHFLKTGFLKAITSLNFIQTILNFVLKIAKKIMPFLQWTSLILALSLGAYTGFLLSALKSYPLLNNPVLPVLFMFSGISSGAAACVLCALTWFKENTHSESIALIHKLETPVVLMEIFLLFAFFMGHYYGGGQKTVAVINALGSGFWAQSFWIGVVGVGIIIPLSLSFILNKKIKHTKTYLVMVASMTLIGVFILRHFILYAGQMTLA
ncbi:formate-dependent nitrite reductase membrane subunit [Gammaproteobacteria bacterium]|nr:formate-dependent nitrite reductase membrane subunit [Gammaproteobacteria bacterium]